MVTLLLLDAIPPPLPLAATAAGDAAETGDAFMGEDPEEEPELPAGSDAKIRFRDSSVIFTHTR